jgi:hypothetical protein
VDAVTAAALLDAAVEGRAAMRRGEDAAVERLEGQYPQMREAMGWLLDQGRVDSADRFATALVPSG